MGSFYWELAQRDGTLLDIPPNLVPEIKKRMDSGQVIHTNSMSIPISEVKYFRQTEKPYSTVPLIEAAARAFREPMYAQDGSIKVKWVKKEVPGRVFAKRYSQIPAYRKLDEEGGMVMVAFKLPIHQIDHSLLQECTTEEVRELTSRN